MYQIQFTDTSESVDYLSYTDLSLILNSKEIGSPSVKTNHIDVIGADGVLDLTEAFGNVKYSNRQLAFDFTIDPGSSYEKMYLYQEVINTLHGKYMEILLTEEPVYKYRGRISVGSYKWENGIVHLPITCDCEPYKISTTATSISASVSGSTTVTLDNDKMRVVPIITSDATFSFRYNGEIYYHTAGVFSIPEIELQEGENTVVVSGTGNVKFTYQKGRL